MIGVFDSGVGGMTVLRSLRDELPEQDFIYFGDTARAPYGSKSKDTIVRYALEDANFLIEKGAKMLVIACNTASAHAYNVIKEKYPNIPIFEVIAPAVEDALEIQKAKRVGVIGTKAIINSGIYKERLEQGGAFVASYACPLLVPFIEEGWTNKIELKMVIRRYLAPFKNINLDVLILGCTHYPIIRNLIEKRVGRKVKVIDSASVIARKVKEFLENEKLESGSGKLEIYLSDKTDQSLKIAKHILGNNIKVYESSDSF